MGSISLSDDDEFAQIVRLAPLVSIDLIIRDAKQNALVALRRNEPAKASISFLAAAFAKTKQSRMLLREFSNMKLAVAQASRMRDF